MSSSGESARAVALTPGEEAARRGQTAFVHAKLGSLLAVVPLGVWTVVHLWNNLAAFEGSDRWQAAVTGYSHPISQAVTGIVVLLPLVVHTVWGIFRMAVSRPNNLRYGTFANFKYLLQRLSGLGLAGFLGAHLWLAMIRPRLLDGRPEPFADIAHEMHHHGPTLVVYCLGVLGIAYHLANGLQTFAMSWGLVVSRAALRRLEGVAWVVFLALLGMGGAAIYALWSAGAGPG
jgi:succinate dehydrogenase / fumarate reductase cytochrome b subunit